MTMTFTHETETRYRSPGRKAERAALRGTFKPTLPPLPAELPENVADYLDSLNRRERRRFAAKARAHAAETRAARDREAPASYSAASPYVPGLSVRSG